MVRKHVRPWDKRMNAKADDYGRKANEHKRDTERIEEQEYPIRGDVEPEVKK